MPQSRVASPSTAPSHSTDKTLATLSVSSDPGYHNAAPAVAPSSSRSLYLCDEIWNTENGGNFLGSALTDWYMVGGG